MRLEKAIFAYFSIANLRYLQIEAASIGAGYWYGLLVEK
jgi:hypothetical protein